MMKVFRNRSIALLLAFLMVFSFSLFSAFAVEADNGNENDVKAIKVDNYHDDIKNPYHPKSLIDWLEKTYNVDITDYYIKASSVIYDSEGMPINDPANDPVIGKYIDSGGPSFNKNLFDTISYDEDELTPVIIGGTPIDYGISHVLFLGTDKPVPPPKGTLRITKEVIGDDSEAGPYAVTIEPYNVNGKVPATTNSINLGGTITEGKNDFSLDPGTYKVWESAYGNADSVEYVPAPVGDVGYVIVQIKSEEVTYLTIKNTFDDPVPEDNLNIHKDIAGFFNGDGPFKVKVMRLPDIRPSSMESLTSEAELNSMITWWKIYDIYEGDNFFRLDPGTYLLWETDSQGGVPSYSGEGTVHNIGKKQYIKFTIDDDLTRINVLNTFDDLEVDIEVIKTIGGTQENPGVPHEGIEFSLTPSELIPVALTENGAPMFPLKGITDSDGRILFENIPQGTYTLSEENLPAGFKPQADRTIVVDSDQNQTIYIINEMLQNEGSPFIYEGSTINGYKYYGPEKDQEIGLKDWTIELRKADVPGAPVAASNGYLMTKTTDENGYYEFTGLEPGTYTVSEVLKPGWENITPIQKTVVIGNERHPLGEQTFVDDDDLKAALHNDRYAFTAQGRIGDNTTYELSINTPPNDHPVDSKNWTWNNNGVPMDFEITFDPDTDAVVYTVGNNGNSKSVSYDLPEDYDFSDIMIRTRATKENSGVMINNLKFNDETITETSAAIGDAGKKDPDILWLSGRNLMDGFTLKGQSTMYWDSQNVPKQSNLAYQIKFGVVPVEEEHNVDFRNQQEPNVIIEKEVIGNPTGSGDFEVSFERIYPNDTTREEITFSALESHDLLDQKILEGDNEFTLERGAYYRVWESRTRGANSVRYSGNTEDMAVPGGESGVVIRVPRTGSITVTITNTFRTPPTVLRGSVTVEYVEIDDDFNEISILQPTSNVVTNAVVGTSYNTTQLSFPGYQFVRVDPNGAAASGNVTLATKHVVYQYIQIDDEPVDPTGTISIEKLLFDDGEAVLDSTQPFTVRVTNENGAFEDFTFSVNNPEDIEDLELGTYTIEEINIPDGFEHVSISSEEVTLEEGDLFATIFVINRVEQEDVDPTGTLYIQKTFTGDMATDDDEAQEFTVQVTGDNGYDEEHTFSVDEPAMIPGLELGTYTIEEINIPDGYSFESITPEEVVFDTDALIFTVVVENSIDVEIDDLDPPEGPVDETPILDEEVPLGEGQLPRTGQRHPRDFFILGLMITGLGVVLKRFTLPNKA